MNREIVFRPSPALKKKLPRGMAARFTPSKILKERVNERHLTLVRTEEVVEPSGADDDDSKI